MLCHPSVASGEPRSPPSRRTSRPAKSKLVGTQPPGGFQAFAITLSLGTGPYRFSYQTTFCEFWPATSTSKSPSKSMSTKRMS